MNQLLPDFVELLIELADADVDFVVVGAYAVAYYGHSRATKDLDVLIRVSPENGRKLYKALAAFGAPLTSLAVEESDFAEYDGVLQLGIPPSRIDIINSISGVTYDEAIDNAGNVDLNGRKVQVIGYEALIKNKLASGRPQDSADVDALIRRVKRPGAAED